MIESWRCGSKKKRRKRSKDASDRFEKVYYEYEWTDSSERSCIFPLANIFGIGIVPFNKSSVDLPLDFSVFMIYSGKPKWRSLGYDDSYGDEAGEVIAYLFGNNYLTAYDNRVIVLYDSENHCHGAYSDSQAEYMLGHKEDNL
jgi:hypothetical protein